MPFFGETTVRENKMNLEIIKEWLIPISTFIGVISTAVGIWLSLKEYRLKLQAETRLAESTRAETDIRLLQLFTEILYIATGRKGGATFSKEILNLLVQKNVLTEEDYKDIDRLVYKITKGSFIAQGVGISSVEAAFASIATLAIQHPVLYNSALQALESFKKTNYNIELSEKYLTMIQNAYKSTSASKKTG
jgi:hypothetical protein